MMKILPRSLMTIGLACMIHTTHAQFHVMSDKAISYVYFLDEKELFREVLNQQNADVKSKKCSIAVTDSVFNKREDVKAETVEEKFTVAYKAGRPVQLKYTLTSNKTSGSAIVPFRNSSNGVYIKATTTTLSDPISEVYGIRYHYRWSEDGRYFAQSVWENATDTNKAPVRWWSIKNAQGIDSISEIRASSLIKIKTVLTSTIRSAGKSACRYGVEISSSLMGKKSMLEMGTDYYFNDAGKIIKKVEVGDKEETGIMTWTYDGNQRLIAYSRNNLLEGEFIRVAIMRDTTGKTTQVHLTDNKQSLRFDFTWK